MSAESLPIQSSEQPVILPGTMTAEEWKTIDSNENTDSAAQLQILRKMGATVLPSLMAGEEGVTDSTAQVEEYFSSNKDEYGLAVKTDEDGNETASWVLMTGQDRGVRVKDFASRGLTDPSEALQKQRETQAAKESSIKRDLLELSTILGNIKNQAITRGNSAIPEERRQLDYVLATTADNLIARLENPRETDVRKTRDEVAAAVAVGSVQNAEHFSDLSRKFTKSANFTSEQQTFMIQFANELARMKQSGNELGSAHALINSAMRSAMLKFNNDKRFTNVFNAYCAGVVAHDTYDSSSMRNVYKGVENQIKSQ